MSEITLLSNQSSSLLASSYAGQGPEMSEYIYDMPRSTINRFKDRMISTKLNGAAWGEQQSLEIPSFGILNRMVLKTVFLRKSNANNTPAPQDYLKKALFARIIDEVAIMNSSRRIMTLTGDTIQYLVYSLPNDERQKWLIVGGDNEVYDVDGQKIDDNNSTMTAGASAGQFGDATEVALYTLLPFSCFKEGGAKHGPFKSNFNTRFCEKLSLTIKLSPKSALTAGITGANPELEIQDAVTCHLLSDFDIIEQKSLLSIEEKNYSLSQNLAQVMSDFNLVKTTGP